MGSSSSEVIAAARAGADWAWAAVYRELAPSVLGYVRARGAADPEDVLGEVFLQVVRDISRFEGDQRDFRAWVFAIAHNRLIDQRRRRERRPREEPTADLGEGGETVTSAEDEALGAVGSERVRRLIGRLSPDQQSVLLLRILGDLTVEQVAEVLGKRPGAVKALQRRGLAAVGREISKEGVTL